MEQAMGPKLKTLISQGQISSRVQELGEQINKFYKDEKIELICVLKGAFIFAADLVRQIESPVEISFLRLSSYEGEKSSGVVRNLLALESSMAEKNVLIVEDIVDTGKTLEHLRTTISKQGPKSLKICSLLLKPECHKTKVGVDFSGFKIENRFVVGYGLDHEGAYRHLPYLAELSL